jgi:hypothetical protein
MTSEATHYSTWKICEKCGLEFMARSAKICVDCGKSKYNNKYYIKRKAAHETIREN